MRVLVTGGSGGLGKAIVNELEKCNHEIVATHLSKLPDDLIVKGNEIKWVRCDLTNPQEAWSVLSRLGEFDAVVHCAAMVKSALIGQQSVEDVVSQVNLNLVSSILIVEKMMPQMIRRDFGRIILFGSVVSSFGSVGLSTYTATKSALHALVKSATREISVQKRKLKISSNFTINIVSPGYSETPMTVNLPDKVKNLVVSKMSSGRFVNPKEVAQLVVFLLKPESESINGTEFCIDGGSFL